MIPRARTFLYLRSGNHRRMLRRAPLTMLSDGIRVLLDSFADSFGSEAGNMVEHAALSDRGHHSGHYWGQNMT